MGQGRICGGLLVALLAIAAGCAGVRTRTADRPKVAILELEGVRSKRVRGEIRERVARLVADRDFEVIDQESYRRVARQSGNSGKSERAIVQVCRELGLDAVVHGRLFRKGEQSGRLGLAVRDGQTGASVDRFSVILHRGKPRERQREKLSGKLFGALDEIAARHRAVAEKRAEEAEADRRANEEEADKTSEGAREGEVARGDEGPSETQDEEPEPEPLDLETDDEGQVIDEEMPEVFDE